MDDVYAGLTELLRPAERGQAPGGWLFGRGRCGWYAEGSLWTRRSSTCRPGWTTPGRRTLAATSSCGRVTGCWCW